MTKPPDFPAQRAPLAVHDHSRDAAGLRYVYPVVSRRAGGLSVGINLNPNNACNWACTYCQVPDLVRGGPPPVDLARLQRELAGFLREVVEGDFLQARVPEGLRVLRDVAFSGNGEPTASAEFPAAVACVLDTLQAALPAALRATCGLVVISNGSQVHLPEVRAALARLGQAGGVLWFKLDRGDAAARQHVNGVHLSDDLVVQRLVQVAGCLPVWLQTCVYQDPDEPGAGDPAAAAARLAALVARALAAGAVLAGVLLYTLARPSLQPGAARLQALDAAGLEVWAAPLRALGLEVRTAA